MSSLAFPSDAAPRTATLRDLPDAIARRGTDALLAVVVIALATALLAFVTNAFSVDSWLALVDGRQVWQSGLPQHDTLAAMSYGVRWLDQQWLAQLATYGIYLVGGLGLLALASVEMMVAGVAGAVVGARRLGASPRSVMLALPLCLWLVIPSHEIRTQDFVIPLFVATVYLLARDSRVPTRRVYWCLPILVLWANLHGTVTLGAGLVALRGGTLAWERRRMLTRSLRAWRRPLVLALGAPVCMLITPYGVTILSYFHEMFLGSSVRDAVTEWQPVTSEFIIAWPFFLLAGAALWSFGRATCASTLWERLALIVLAAGSILVIRNVLFFSLGALMLLPLAFDTGTHTAESRVDRRRARLNTAMLGSMVVALVIAVGATLVRSNSSIELSYQRIPILNVLKAETRADPSLKVFADVRFADWLLWRDPALSGRIAYDASFELLTSHQTIAVQRVLSVIGPDWKQGARGYRLIVLDKSADPDTVKAFLQETGSRVLYNDGERIVILRSARAAE